MKKVIPVLLVLLVAGVAFALWKKRHRENANSQTQLVIYGNVDIRQVQLAFNASERISSLLVQEGDRAHSGQLLGVLESRRFEANVTQRQARVAAQRELLARLEAGNRPEEIRKAAADLDAAKAELQNAERTFERVSTLVEKNVETPQRIDDTRALLNVAKARANSAQQAYDLMVLGPRKEDIAAARATLQANEAELALALRELADAKLYSPTNGIIQARLLEPGDMASPAKPVFTVAMDDPLWVRAYLPETDLGKVKLGQKAVVNTDSYPGKNYEGWIGFISPTAEFTPKSVETAEVRTRLVYQVRVFVRNPQGELRLERRAVGHIPLDSHIPADNSTNIQAGSTR